MKYPIGIQSFETLRKGGFVYVDKTDLVYQMVQGHVYFLSRPRRFGKSLLVSTLRAYFEGRKDLFEGLRIMDLEKDWNVFPVLHFDLNLVNKQDPDGLLNYLFDVISKAEQTQGIEPLRDESTASPTRDVARRFAHLIEELHRQSGCQVAVLIDEYDKPLLDLLETGSASDASRLEADRETLKYFFATFKAADDHLRFVLLTGITKFSQVSMFSGFNQPDDISFDQRYDTLCGITESELYSVFAESIQALAEEDGCSVAQIKAELKDRYDGYHFSRKLTDVYNPFSIINAFAKRSLGDFWFASGTPSYLVRLLSHTQEDVMKYTSQEYAIDEFVNYKADAAQPLPMIFQSGYLTIKSYDRAFGLYRLDFPNNEVRQGFLTLLANDYFQKTDSTQPWIVQVVKSLQSGDLELTRRLFTSFLAETPYAMRPKKDQKGRELYFHYTFYLIMRLISCYTVYTEKQMSEGRADCIIETQGKVYIFEFKLDGTADEALRQIRDRGYARAYEASGRPIYKIGVSFSSKTGTIDDWKTE